MIDSEIWLYIGLILLLATVHTLGDVIYKKATTSLVEKNIPSKLEFSDFRIFIIPIFVIGFSICISLGVRIVYGILLGVTPLSITAGSFLGSITIFSIIFGKAIFQEQFSHYQILGILLIVLGIIMLV